MQATRYYVLKWCEIYTRVKYTCSSLEVFNNSLLWICRVVSWNKLRLASAMSTGILVPVTVWPAVCLGKIHAYVNRAGRVDSAPEWLYTQAAVCTTGRIASFYLD